MPDVSERQLVAGLKAGDEAAFVDLVREHGPHLLQTATRILGDPSEAKDCLQETFIHVHRKIDTFRAEAQFATWLHRILINNCLMKLRRRREETADSVGDLIPSFDAAGCRVEPPWHVPNDIEEQMQRREVRALVLAAIAQLPDTYRTVIMLRDIEEYSTNEAADALSLTVPNVKVRLHRARAALKILLDRSFQGASL